MVVATVVLNVLCLALPIVVLQVYDRVLPNAALHTLLLLAIGLAGVMVIEGVLRWARAYLVAWNGARFHHEATCKTVDRLLACDLASFERESLGTHLNRLQAIDQVAESVSGEARLVVIDLCFVAVFLFVFWTIAGNLVAVPLVLLAITAVIAAFLVRALRKSLADSAKTEDRRASFIHEVLSGMETVKLLAMEPLMARRYERLRAQTSANAYRVIFLSNLSQHLGGLLSNLTIVLVVVLGAKAVMENSLSLGGLSACMLLAGRSIQAPLRAFSLMSRLQISSLAKQRFGEALKTPPEAGSGQPDVTGIEGAIELRGAHFGYGADDTPLLDGVDLKIKPGEFIAITGGSGVGKSTLLMLMAGLLMPSKGEVLVDGRDIRQVNPWSLRRFMVLLGQKHVLFKGTILDNLTMFQRKDRLEDGLAAARMLGLDSAIGRLPDGYDTEVTDSADHALADGVRQGISVARAFTHDTRVILCDEANSCFDRKTDQFFNATLRRVKGDVTVVIVTHRPSLLSIADRIFALRDGKLVARPLPETNHPALAAEAAAEAGSPTRTRAGGRG